MNRKFTKKYFYYRLLTSLFVAGGAFLYIMSSAFSSDVESGEIDPGALQDVVFFGAVVSLIAYIIAVIYYYLYWKTSAYEFTDTGITCTKGVLFKKKSFVEYHKIHTVNKKQGLIQQFFDIAYLLVDSGATSNALKAEITIIEDGLVVTQLMDRIKKSQSTENKVEDDLTTEKPKTENLYNFTSSRKFLYSLLNTLTGGFIILLVIGVTMSILPIIKGLIQEVDLPLLEILLVIIALYILVIAGSFVIGVLNSFISYFDFQIYRNNKIIEIQYGLFVKNTNSFHIDRIKVIKIKQSFIKRLFGFVNVDIEVIGYGDSSSTENDKVTNVFIPLCKKSEVNEYLENILGYEYVPEEVTNNAKAFFPMFSWTCLVTTIMCFIPVSIFAIWAFYFQLWDYLLLAFVGTIIISFFINIFIIINARMKYNNEGISVSKEKTSITHGGFTTQTSVFLNRHIIAVEDKTTPLRSKKGIYSYIIHFRGNAESNELVVDILDEEVREKLLEVVKY